MRECREHGQRSAQLALDTSSSLSLGSSLAGLQRRENNLFNSMTAVISAGANQRVRYQSILSCLLFSFSLSLPFILCISHIGYMCQVRHARLSLLHQRILKAVGLPSPNRGKGYQLIHDHSCCHLGISLLAFEIYLFSQWIILISFYSTDQMFEITDLCKDALNWSKVSKELYNLTKCFYYQ